jgi:hypothetical protein
MQSANIVNDNNVFSQNKTETKFSKTTNNNNVIFNNNYSQQNYNYSQFTTNEDDNQIRGVGLH